MWAKLAHAHTHTYTYTHINTHAYYIAKAYVRWLAHQEWGLTVYDFLFFFLCVPQLYLWGSPFGVRLLRIHVISVLKCTFVHATESGSGVSKFMTTPLPSLPNFHLAFPGTAYAGKFLYQVLMCLEHPLQGHQTPCDKMFVHRLVLNLCCHPKAEDQSLWTTWQ